MQSLLLPLLLGPFLLALMAAEDLRFSENVDNDGKVRIKWASDGSNITIEISANTTGWVGCGFSPNGGMTGADLIIGGMFPNQSIYFADYHAIGSSRPLKDEKQNYQLISVTENETTTTLRFSRAFRTCDDFDLDITEDTMTVIAAFGRDDDINYHRENRFQKNMILLNDGESSNDPEPVVSSSFDILMQNYTVPSNETTYACQFTGPFVFSRKYHVYKIDPVIQPRSKNLVHHIVLYSCPNITNITSEAGPCFGVDPKDAIYYQCTQVVAAWAVGGNSLKFPPEAGLSIGTHSDPHYYRLEIHYNNPNGLSDTDSFDIHALCKTEKFQDLNAGTVPDMEVFAFFPHTHLKGISVQGALYRNGTQITLLGSDLKYDFNLQRTRLINTTTVKVGDEIQVKCVYNTKGLHKTLNGGLSTKDEMCLIFYYYYPKNNIASCDGQVNRTLVAELLGVDPSLPLVLSLANYSWDAERTKVAQQAYEASAQSIMILDDLGNLVTDVGLNHEIIPPERGACSNATYPVPGTNPKTTASPSTVMEAFRTQSTHGVSTDSTSQAVESAALMLSPSSLTLLLLASVFCCVTLACSVSISL
ncbi:putative DBH-like monooxygenase protein 2 isoform X2 [Rhinatrema bivittatum]|uniref:putative DBH-like monooxygenase protein 2 isoform X2 n=1 Tax=Rhinatrema bivittatum TaxID=194408 RepID=UPI0011262014|nr:putative DBH-like monooxygenase protein 2 isoform X2 [Rhinatrema bivittatum]